MSFLEKLIFESGLKQRQQLFGKVYRWVLIVALTKVFCTWKGIPIDVSKPLELIQQLLSGQIIPVLLFFLYSLLACCSICIDSYHDVNYSSLLHI
jgi:uncharacterized membrane protein YhaH (DUF805 family)